MGYFSLPTGNFELLLKKKGRGAHKTEWKSVMITDTLYPAEVASCVEDWERNYKVAGAKFNNRAVKLPENYHWEVYTKVRTPDGFKTEVLGVYKKRADAKAVVDARKEANWYKPKEEQVFAGVIRYVQD